MPIWISLACQISIKDATLQHQVQLSFQPEARFSPFSFGVQVSQFLLFKARRLYDIGVRNFRIHNASPLGCLAHFISLFGTDPSKLDELGCLR
ncbi:hypothetical protein MtrunA17_Chr1g0191491 [Medicago truncatula]|uniref:Uncharacterized protein n=1 Tax=Medicago truncatula TaxID=3880 RepID=A0A396K2K0_MEDTR|nr:hypothetical protein MtrunA17_Chr1g0191491 [Medicago truncatula]